jgi:hypothetical protein
MKPSAIDVTNPPWVPPARALPMAPHTAAINTNTINAGQDMVIISQTPL